MDGAEGKEPVVTQTRTEDDDTRDLYDVGQDDIHGTEGERLRVRFDAKRRVTLLEFREFDDDLADWQFRAELTTATAYRLVGYLTKAIEQAESDAISGVRSACVLASFSAKSIANESG